MNSEQNFDIIPKFDPGYAQFLPDFPDNAIDLLKEISSIKQNHQKKFTFTNFERQICPIVKTYAAFYLGCMLWGGFLSSYFQSLPVDIVENPMLELSEEEKTSVSEDKLSDVILKFVCELNKSAQFYFKRNSFIKPDLVDILKIYKKFTEINNSFVNTKSTSDIILPEEFEYMKNLSKEELILLKISIHEVLKTRNLEGLLQLEFVKNKM